MKETVEIGEIPSCIDLGTAALGLLGHYNRQTNVKRRENHKPDLDFQYYHLCTPSQPYSEFLYGDDVTKNVQEIQNVNKFGRKISSDDQYGRGSGFGMRDRGVEVAIKVTEEEDVALVVVMVMVVVEAMTEMEETHIMLRQKTSEAFREISSGNGRLNFFTTIGNV